MSAELIAQGQLVQEAPNPGASSCPVWTGERAGLTLHVITPILLTMAKGLQAEIKQSVPFRSPATEALLSILRTAAVIEHRLGEELKPFGITGPQHNVLRILRGAREKGLCGREIGERMVARVPDVPRMLDRMEAMKLISRERDTEDRRHVTARITQKGLDLLTKVEPELDRIERSRFNDFDAKQIQALIDGLALVRETF